MFSCICQDFLYSKTPMKLRFPKIITRKYGKVYTKKVPGRAMGKPLPGCVLHRGGLARWYGQREGHPAEGALSAGFVPRLNYLVSGRLYSPLLALAKPSSRSHTYGCKGMLRNSYM
jgi:hypothetical protein